MTRLARRGPWLPEEDNALIALVQTPGPNNWVRISQQLQHRSPKQCRERYHQNLKPSLNHEPITAQEGEMIEQMVNEMGKRWAEIARRLGNRSDNAVKNWWNGSMNRRKRSPAHNHNSVKNSGNRLHSAAAAYKPHRHAYDFQAEANSPVHAQLSERQDPLWVSQEHRTLQPPSFLPQTSGRHSPIRSDLFLGHSSKSYTSPQSTHDNHNSYFPPHYTEVSSSRLPPLRLPPIASTQTDARYAVTFGKPCISPAVSEFAYSISSKQAPSLMSDAQSTYSISPKTVASPRLSVPPSWNHEGGGIHDYQGLRGQIALSPLETDVTTLAPYSKTGLSHSYSSTHHTSSAGFTKCKGVLPSPGGCIRDSRMHVSSLVQ